MQRRTGFSQILEYKTLCEKEVNISLDQSTSKHRYLDKNTSRY